MSSQPTVIVIMSKVKKLDLLTSCFLGEKTVDKEEVSG